MKYFNVFDLFYNIKLQYTLTYRSGSFIILSLKISFDKRIELFVDLCEKRTTKPIFSGQELIQLSCYEIKSIQGQVISNLYDKNPDVISLNNETKKLFLNKLNNHIDSIELLKVNETLTL